MENVTLRRLPMLPTRTYSLRWATWMEFPLLPCDGVLTLGQVKERGGAVEEATYGVDEVRCYHPNGRSFSVRKLGAAIGGEDEAYVTTVLPRGSQCTCKAGSTRNEICKHRDALAALLAAGVIPAKEMIGS